MKTVSFYTLGCKLNFSESSAIARQFREAGFGVKEFTDGADVYVINTCSVTDHADRKCRKVVREALRHNPSAFVAIVGCYAQLKPQEIADIPGVDAVLGAAEKFRMLELIQEFAKQPAPTASSQPAAVYHSEIGEANSFVPSFSLEERTRAFLKVQDGCDYKCTFCTIPLARGASRSDSMENVLQNVRGLAEAGTQEIVLTGINLGDYGQGIERSFFDLVQMLDTAEHVVGRFRISSIEPNLLTDEIIAFVAASQCFMPHFHVPLQSGSDKILAKMRRRYKRELYASRVAAIKAAMPHACIGVDVIVGFPGETDAEFLETYQFLNELDVSYLHVFPYSERANTLAASMRGRQPERVRHERTQQLRQLSEKKKRFFYESQLGQTRPVLFEEKAENGLMHGWTDNYVRVSLPYDPLLVNEVVPVRLENLGADGVVAGLELQPIPA